jgi:hypothetical protein
MNRTTILFVLMFALGIGAAPGFTQSDLSPYMDAYLKAKEARRQEELEKQKLDLQRQRLEMERSLGEQSLEIERQRLATEKATPPPPTGGLSAEAREKLSGAIDEALGSISRTNPDLKDHLDEMMKLTSTFTLGNAGDVSLERYFEGLYVISKYSRFSPGAKTRFTGKPLTNEDIIAMSKAGLTVEIIRAKVRTSQPQYRLDSTDLIELKAAKVPDDVIRAMVESK